MQIRALGHLDLAALQQLDQASFSLPWPKQALHDELIHCDARPVGLWEADNLVAALLLRLIGEEWWIMRIMVHPAYRRLGLGVKLLQLAKRVSSQEKRDLWLEVSSENKPAIALYSQAGFKIVRKRKAYYPDGSDAEEMNWQPKEQPVLEYELLDSGDFQKWERFGLNTVVRPMKEASWKPLYPTQTWKSDAVAVEKDHGFVRFEKYKSFVEPWSIAYGDIVAGLHAQTSRNVGIFPEQEANWRWLHNMLAGQQAQQPKVLNLFAYTGMASWVCAQAGAHVTHVDAAKSTVQWASQNAKDLHIQGRIRWIVEDANRYLEREHRRGNRYDAIILDPPPVGRAQGKTFVFETHVQALLKACKQVLAERPIFVLFNCYALGYTPMQAEKLMRTVFDDGVFESGYLNLYDQAHQRDIPCSVYVRCRLDL